jgi:hypothetical protein
VRLQINGKPWTVKDTDDLPKQEFGECIWSERLIQIRTHQDEQERLDTLIHELLHACQPGWNEQNVARVALVLRNGLWGDSWRRKKKDR